MAIPSIRSLVMTREPAAYSDSRAHLANSAFRAVCERCTSDGHSLSSPHGKDHLGQGTNSEFKCYFPTLWKCPRLRLPFAFFRPEWRLGKWGDMQPLGIVSAENAEQRDIPSPVYILPTEIALPRAILMISERNLR